MAQSFAPGDDLIFQLESGFGLLRVIEIEDREVDDVLRRMILQERQVVDDVFARSRTLPRGNVFSSHVSFSSISSWGAARKPARRRPARGTSDMAHVAVAPARPAAWRRVQDR